MSLTVSRNRAVHDESLCLRLLLLRQVTPLATALIIVFQVPVPESVAGAGQFFCKDLPDP